MGRPLPFLCISSTTFDGLRDAGLGVTCDFSSEFTIKFDSGFPYHFPACLGGLVDLPSAWWMAIQRVIFSDSEVSCQLTALNCDTGAKTQVAMRHSLLSCVCVIAKALLSEERAQIILENFRMKGYAHYLASVAKAFKPQNM